MDGPALEPLRWAGVQAPAADLPRLAWWRAQGCAPTPTTVDALRGGQMPRRAEGDAGQPGQADGRGGRRERAHAPPTARSRPGPAPHRAGATDAPGLDSQARLDGAAALGDSDHGQPSRASPCEARPGTGVGGSVRAEQLRV